MSTLPHGMMRKKRWCQMKTRKQSYGEMNCVGRRIEALRKASGSKQKDFVAKLQAMGLDINPTSYSKLEGQIRAANDRELWCIARALGVTVDDLFPDTLP